MQQYNDLQNRIINDGEWVHNERTGKDCKVIINGDMEYDFCPLVTTRKSNWKSAVAEIVGYLRGYTNAADFRALGTKTWDANANENEAWLNNPHRSGEDDMGRVYGAHGRGWRKPEWYSYQGRKKIVNNLDAEIELAEKINDMENTIDQVKNVYEDLRAGVDNRGEIITFYNPGEFHMGCLRPCVHTHTFSLVNGRLDLTSYQRSCDVPLGLNFNMVQLHFLLLLMAQITNNKPGTVYHKIINAHCYKDQYELMKEEAARTPLDIVPTMTINPRIKTLEDVETIFTTDDVTVGGYESHPSIKYPFSV